MNKRNNVKRLKNNFKTFRIIKFNKSDLKKIRIKIFVNSFITFETNLSITL